MKKLTIASLIYFFLISLTGHIHIAAQETKPAQTAKSSGNIYLYGEQHAIEKILKKEIEIWGDYYNKGLRHLFIELPCYTTEFLNIWMNSKSDEILDNVYDDWKGTACHNPVVKDFYKEIKKRFPATIFHGTDVGHQYQTTGKRYLDYLTQQNKEKSEQFRYAKEAIEQGKHFYDQIDGAYRENKMSANFVREFNNLKNESIVGIYGTAHIGINSMDHSKTVPSMANQLQKLYTNQLFTENIADLVKDADPQRIDSIQINGIYYKASYFGKSDLTGFKNFKYREFWRLEGAYNDYKEAPKTGDVLPYNNYPMKIETGQVFVIDYMKTDGTSTRSFYRSDGRIWNKLPSTEEFKIE